MILHKNPTIVNLYQISSIVSHRVCCVATKLKKSDHIMLIFDLSDDNLRVEVHSSLILRSWLPVGGLVITWSPSTNWSVSIAAQGLLEKLSVTDILWSDAHTHTHTYTLVKTFFGSYCTILWKPQTFWNSGDMRFLRRIGRLDSPREWKRGASEFPYYSHTAGVWVGLVLASPGQLPSWPPWSPPPSRHLEQVHNLSTSATRHLAQVLCHHNVAQCFGDMVSIVSYLPS